MNARGLIIALAAWHGLTGVAIAATAAHTVANAHDARSLMIAAGMQIAHALAALVAPLALPSRAGVACAALFIAGALLFAAAIYARVFAGVGLGPMAPAGGATLMLGWAAMILAGLRAA